MLLQFDTIKSATTCLKKELTKALTFENVYDVYHDYTLDVHGDFSETHIIYMWCNPDLNDKAVAVVEKYFKTEDIKNDGETIKLKINDYVESYESYEYEF